MSGVVVQTWPDRIGIQVQDSKATLMIPPNLVWLDGEDPLEPPR